MSKNDCTNTVYAWTTKSGLTEQIKLYHGVRADDSQEFFFLENGADCTKLVSINKNGELVYQGGGWFEKLLGNSFKGTSEDVNKLISYIVKGTATMALTILALSLISTIIKHKRK